MSARDVVQGGSRFPVRRFGGFAVVGLPAEFEVLTAPAIAGELCAALDSGAPGLIVDMSGAGLCDSACLGPLMRAARRARGWGTWGRETVAAGGP